MTFRQRLETFQNLGLLGIFIVLIVLFQIIYPGFLRLQNIRNALLSISIIGIIAVPMTMLLISGGVDLSVGSMMGLAASICALLISRNIPIVPAILITLAAGGCVGFINGLLVTKIKINSFIATIGMLSVLNGIALVMTSDPGQKATFSGSIGIPDKKFGVLGLGSLGPVPIQIILLIIVFGIGYFFLNHTQFGRKVYASGANETAAHLSGVPVQKTRVIMFVFTSVTAAFGGIILASQFLAGHPRIGSGYELLILTAVILGGTAFTGGKGSMQGVLLGVLIMGTLRYGMDVLGIIEFFKQIANGTILLIAVGTGQLREKFMYKSYSGFEREL